MQQLHSAQTVEEGHRLAELLSYAQLDTSSDADLDAITALASKLCGSTSSMLNFIDLERQWSKSLAGLDASWQQMDRSESMCTHTVEERVLLEVSDVRTDPRFKHLELAQEGSSVRHYAGMPLLTPSGNAIGALCVISDKPGKLTDSQKESLQQLSQLAMNIIISKSPLSRRSNEFDDTESGVVYIDPAQSTIIYANEQVGRYIGHDGIPLRSVPTLQLCSSWTPEFFEQLTDSSGVVHSPDDEFFELIRKEGSTLAVSARWSKMNHYEKPLIVGTLVDSSEKAAITEASKERTLFFELSRDVLAVCEPDGTIIDVNPSFTRVLGYEISDLKQKTPLELVHPDDVDKTVTELQKLNDGAQPTTHTNRVRDIHGNYRWLTWSSVRSESGKIYASANDITESRERDRLLSLMQCAIDRCQNPIIIASLEQPGGTMEYVNPAFEKTTGYSQEEAIGQNCKFLQGKDRNQPGIRIMREALSNREEAHVMLRNYRKDGSMFWNELYLSPFKHESDEITHYVGVQYDVTQLVNQRDQIIRLNRIEALKSAFNATQGVASSSNQLDDELCEIATTVGEYSLVWIADVDHENGSIKLQSAHGVGAGELPPGNTLSELPVKWLIPYLAPAIDAQQPIIFQHLNGSLPAEHENRLASEGFNGIAAYPVTKDGRTDKLVCFYSNEVNAFDAQENIVIGGLLEDYRIALKLVSNAQEMDRIAHRDEITGLPNLKLLANLARESIKGSDGDDRLPRGIFVTVMIDRLIDLMGQVGRVKGRALLQSVADKLEASLPPQAVVSHAETGQFCLFMNLISETSETVDFIENSILPIFEEKFLLSDEVELYLSPRIGISFVQGQTMDVDSAIDQSKLAALANVSAHTPYLFYSDALAESSITAIQREVEIREAIRLDQFELHFQGKVNLRSNQISSLEGLLRWNHPDRGLVSPGEFIPILEETGLIVNLTDWLLREAFKTALSVEKSIGRAVRVAINLSQIQLMHPNFLQTVDQVVAEFGLQPADNLIDLEITESLLADDIMETRRILKSLQSRGFHISIDDFGTGFSSLSYLARLPFDSLKIDLSFVRRMTASVEDMSIVSTIIGLSKSLDKNVIAEGVETREQANLLRLINCTEAQGYLINKPSRHQELIPLLQQKEVIQFSKQSTQH